MIVVAMVVVKNDTLYLIVVKEVWDRIISVDKTIEYRECGEYWDKRIKNRHYNYLRITNGYGNDTRPFRLYNYTGYTKVMKDNKKHYAIDINSELIIEERKYVKKKLDN